ncbi:unnamed protein product [Acanthoscelides obtectus]|uniref:Uncharacterized protein n=1 Tax=Acanthoscelides obtectus TaxID=200917 RepID=A0A9P0LZ18_ACAOB|nr:unnamed protein product [Acanthoscelides obtectus]CAK1665297.1 hypothetical protein AOBTE_LOCUS24746 [Acanthoscelides obtectus]
MSTLVVFTIGFSIVSHGN